jgi:hypothetical protein
MYLCNSQNLLIMSSKLAASINHNAMVMDASGQLVPAKNVFCKVWPEAKLGLQALAALVPNVIVDDICILLSTDGDLLYGDLGCAASKP